ncbi:Citrate synthase [Thalictrum thalictroides]|uniref:Citrate synthase n=1 Tax=Thalictrum thalictroides TaxID=46969 RepID=A0A7J6XCU9_THATH|nr:Citrate synthase [Thalictrum thalictroides]
MLSRTCSELFALSLYQTAIAEIGKRFHNHEGASIRCLSVQAPTIAAAAYLRMAGRPPVLPSSNLSYSENFLYMLDSLAYKPNPRLARVLDVLFILHAEHEINCSTAAARHLASSGVDVYTALAGAVGALYGPLHGGANEDQGEQD